MQYPERKTGFNRLDFQETKKIAELVGFDAGACARGKKSCGPGCDWLARDLRYVTLKLLQFLRSVLETGGELPAPALAWLEQASHAAREYAEMEKKLYPVFALKSSPQNSSE